MPDLYQSKVGHPTIDVGLDRVRLQSAVQVIELIYSVALAVICTTNQVVVDSSRYDSISMSKTDQEACELLRVSALRP